MEVDVTHFIDSTTKVKEGAVRHAWDRAGRRASGAPSDRARGSTPPPLSTPLRRFVPPPRRNLLEMLAMVIANATRAHATPGSSARRCLSAAASPASAAAGAVGRAAAASR